MQYIDEIWRALPLSVVAGYMSAIPLSAFSVTIKFCERKICAASTALVLSQCQPSGMIALVPAYVSIYIVSLAKSFAVH